MSDSDIIAEAVEMVCYSFGTRCGVIRLTPWAEIPMDVSIGLILRFDPEAKKVAVYPSNTQELPPNFGTIYTRQDKEWSVTVFDPRSDHPVMIFPDIHKLDA